MIRRPVNKRFSPAVRAGRKVTTMREKAWPVGVPILLYNWSEKPYRSKQVEVAVVVVLWVRDVRIHRAGDELVYELHAPVEELHANELWQVEGFESQEEMNAWFLELVIPGQVLERKLMWFELQEERGAA